VSIANPKRSALGLTKLKPRVVIAQTLIGAAVVLASCVVGAAVASADPDASGTPANPFGALGCSCQETDLTSSVVPGYEIDRGIIAGSHGLAAWMAPLPE
jgi:hypothetical protein